MKLVRVIFGCSMARFSWRDFSEKDPLCMCYLCLDDTMYVGVQVPPAQAAGKTIACAKFVTRHEVRHNLPRNNVLLLLSNEDTRRGLIDSSGDGLYGE